MKEISQQLNGVASILLTPFQEDRSLDEEGLRSNINYLIESGVKNNNGVLVPIGTTGECYALTNQERKNIAEIVVEQAGGQVPVFVGCNNESTRKVLDLAKHAQSIGADGIMLLPPYYRTLNENGLFDFYKGICQEVKLPILVYNNPSVTQIDIPVDLMKRMTKLDNIAGLKECTPNGIKFEQMARNLGDEIAIMNGNMENFEPFAAMMGTRGFVSGIVNFAPKTSVSLAKALREEDYATAKEIQQKLMPFFDLYFGMSPKYGGNFGSTFLKECMKIRNLPAGPTRRPAPSITDAERNSIQKVLTFN